MTPGLILRRDHRTVFRARLKKRSGTVAGTARRVLCPTVPAAVLEPRPISFCTFARFPFPVSTSRTKASVVPGPVLNPARVQHPEMAVHDSGSARLPPSRFDMSHAARRPTRNRERSFARHKDKNQRPIARSPTQDPRADIYNMRAFVKTGEAPLTNWVAIIYASAT